MKILLTGSRGNLGQAIVAHARQLNQIGSGVKIVEINRDNWGQLDEICEGREQASDTTPVGAILHAGYDLHTQLGVSPVEMIDSNLMTTARLLAAAKRHGITRFGYVSSCAVYGNGPTPEGTCSPTTPYGTIKHLNETMVESFAKANGMTSIAFRVFNLYGGRDRFSIVHHLHEAARGGSEFRLNNEGEEFRDFIHVDDVARAITAAMVMNCNGGHIDVGTGMATQIRSIMAIAQDLYPGLRITCNGPRRGGPNYSCADVTRLRSIFHGDFINLPGYLSRMSQPTFDVQYERSA